MAAKGDVMYKLSFKHALFILLIAYVLIKLFLPAPYDWKPM